MNTVEQALLEHMENDKFQNAVSDDFAFVDSLIDQEDLDKHITKKEANKDGYDD